MDIVPGSFGYCTSLESVTLPSTISGVGEYAFDGCSSLKKVMFNQQGVLYIGTMAFHQCSSLENINLPSNLAVIEDYAFAWCRNLREVVLDDGFNEGLRIGYFAFGQCHSLESITLPSTVSTIGDDAFFKCDNLRQVVLNGEGPRKIAKAFGECTTLESIKFGTISTRLESIIEAGLNIRRLRTKLMLQSTTVKSKGEGA